MVRKDDSYYHVDEQLDEYRILNMDETGRFMIEYDIPSGFERSKPFNSFLEANQYIQYLQELNRDPSNYIAVMGYLYGEEDDDNYLYIVYKHMPLYT